MAQLSIITPLGELTLSEADEALVSIDWGRGRDLTSTPLLQAAASQLHAYFDTGRPASGIPLAPDGTPFQRRVWEALRAIPSGETRSYGDVARVVGCASARAVGRAIAVNPVPILIPCHRVIAADGTLGGYSGADGLATKRYLLTLERRAKPELAGDQR